MMYENKSNSIVTNVPRIPVHEVAKLPQTDLADVNINPVAYSEVFTVVTHSVIIPNVIPNRYLVSNFGRLYDCKLNKFLNFTDNGGGYLKCKLSYFIDPYTVGYKDVYIHRLVCFFYKYFPNCENMQVEHRNGNKLDNSVTNLIWVTPEENRQLALQNGLIRSGEDMHNAVLSNTEAEEVCKLIVKGKSNKEISEILAIPSKQVSEIRTGRAYKNIGEKYSVTSYFKSNNEVLTDAQVHNICQLLIKGNTSRAVAEIVGCSEHQVKGIKYSGNYPHISSLYRLDLIKKDSSNNGIKSSWNRIPENIVRGICVMLQANEQSCAEIAKHFNVSHNTVVSIKNGHYYRDISKNYDFSSIPKRQPAKSEALVRSICQTLQDHPERGISSIAREFNVNIDVVRHIKKRESYKNIVKDYIW